MGRPDPISSVRRTRRGDVRLLSRFGWHGSQLPFFGLLAVYCGPVAVAQTEVRIIQPASEKEVSALFFGANEEFTSPALYYGTLPKNDPQNLRRAFKDALACSGVKVIRFPGGTYVHTYLFDNPELCDELGVRTRTWFYDADNWDRNLFVRLENLLDFCREAGVGLIYQLPTCFVIAEGKIVTFVDTDYSKTGAFDPQWHLAEAAAYVQKIVRLAQGIAPGVVRVWEVGNEEWANMDAAHYSAVCRTCIAAVRQLDRRTPIVVTGQGFLPDIALLLRETGHLKQVSGLTAHHCFGAWYGHSEKKRTDIENFVKADYDITKWLDVALEGLAKAGIKDLPQSVTECMIHKMEDWDSFKLVPTMAHALAYVLNWGDVLRHPQNNMGVFHDLQSPYFGIMQFDVWWDEAERKFMTISPEKRADHADLLANFWFERTYVLSPTGYVNQMLSEMCGGKLLLLDLPHDSPLTGLAAVKDKEVVIVIANRQNVPAPLVVSWRGGRASRPARLAAPRVRFISADTPYAALPGEYRTGELRATVRSSEVQVTAPPLSVIQMRAKL